MFGNQIIKNLTTGRTEWQTEAYGMQQAGLISLVGRSHHFYFGSHANIEKDLGSQIGNKRLFMGDLANNLKLPYDTFLLCFRAGPHLANDPHAKYAMLVQRYVHGDVGITVEFLVSDGSKQWILLPFTRLYMLNQTLEESKVHWQDVETTIMTDGNVPYYQTNTGIFSFIKKEHSQEFIGPKGILIDIQKTLGAVLNYFLLLYNQKYIVTETIYRDKSSIKMKKNKKRLFDYKILCVQLPKGGKKYRYEQRDNKSKGIMPFSEVPGIWKTYKEDAPLFGNPKLVGDFWIPAHVRGSKKSGFVDKDYCVRVN